MDPATKPPLSVMSSVLPARIPRLAVKVQGAVEGGFQRQRNRSPEFSSGFPGDMATLGGMADDARWRKLAADLDFAILACQFSNGEPFPYLTRTTPTER